MNLGFQEYKKSTKNYTGKTYMYKTGQGIRYKYVIKTKGFIFSRCVKEVDDFTSEQAAYRAMVHAMTVLQGGAKYDPNL